MTMVWDPCRKTEATLEDIESLPVIQQAKRRHELAEQLGFNTQLQNVDLKAEEAAVFYEELTGYELQAWSIFLATYYSRADKRWEEYQFDQVPIEVMEEIAFADRLEVFSDVEIWTPERARTNNVLRMFDPVAVGVIGRRIPGRQEFPDIGKNATNIEGVRCFPVVKWGQERVLTFDEVERGAVRCQFLFDFWEPIATPEPVLAYALNAFRDNPRSPIKIGRSVRRHCDQRMLTVNGTRVCGTCGGTK